MLRSLVASMFLGCLALPSYAQTSPRQIQEDLSSCAASWQVVTMCLIEGDQEYPIARNAFERFLWSAMVRGKQLGMSDEAITTKHRMFVRTEQQRINRDCANIVIVLENLSRCKKMNDFLVSP